MVEFMTIPPFILDAIDKINYQDIEELAFSYGLVK
jgi:hypothetical protein